MVEAVRFPFMFWDTDDDVDVSILTRFYVFFKMYVPASSLASRSLELHGAAACGCCCLLA